MALELIKNPSLAERTSLNLGGTAEVEVVLRDARDLDDLGNFLATHACRQFAIGEGTKLRAPCEHLYSARIRASTPPGPDRVEKVDNKMIVS